MTGPRSFQWYKPLLAALSGFLGGVYFTYTGESLSWRADTFGGDPLLPVQALFDIHPLLGIGFFTAGAFGLVWAGQSLELTDSRSD